MFNYLEQRNLLGDCDLVGIGGSVKYLIDDNYPERKEFLLEQIKISKELHQAKKVILINHTDCGAYGGSKMFSNEGEEREFHLQQLKKAKEVIKKRFPELEVETVFAEIREGGIDFKGV